MTRFNTALIATALLAMAQPSHAQDLTISFEGIKMPKGAIMVALFDSEAAFDGAAGKPMRMVAIPVTSGRAQTVIKGLPAGRYGVKSFHDVDGDGKMGANPFGMPTEPFAFSNNATGLMGPAKWAAAAFSVDAATVTHVITID